jgi:hypothetical protein
MKKSILREIIENTFDSDIQEATSSGIARGSYKPPIRPGLTYWGPEDLQPFVNSASNYVDAEINYDSLDGHIDTPKKEIKKKEKIAKKIQKLDFIQDAPVEGDDEYAQAPFKVLTPSYRDKGDESVKKPRMKKKKFNFSQPFISESTGTISSGSFRMPLRPGLRVWDENENQPFNEKLSGYDNAEIYVDSLDGNIDTKNVKQKEKRAKKISNYEKKHPIQSDDDGDILNNNPLNKKSNIKNTSQPFVSESETKEDLAVWFGTKKKPKGSKQPKGPWVNICRKKEGGGHPPCGRPEADSKGYPKCRAAGVAAKMTDAQKRSACQQKRKAEKKNPKSGTGNSPTMVSYKPKNESVLIDLILKSLKG